MGKLFGFLGGPIKDVISSIGGVLDSLSTTEEEKLSAKSKLLEIQAAFQTKVMELDVAFAAEQAKVVVAEAQSESWLTRNWRPILMLTFTFIIAWNYIVAALFGMTTLEIVPDMWELLRLGIGGYIGGRTIEKVTPVITDAIKEFKKK